MSCYLKKLYWTTFYAIILTYFASAQTVDLETLGKGKAFQLGGGISANGVFYNANLENAREPFTYSY